MFYFIVSSGDEKPARKSKKPTKFEAQRTIKEGYGQTYNKPMVWGIDGGKYFIRDKLVCKNAYLIHWKIFQSHRGTEDRCKMAVSLQFCTIRYVEIVWI